MSKNKRDKTGGSSAENTAHNLDIDDDERDELEHRPPSREAGEADFGAEAHGFTGFEEARKGSTYDKRDGKKKKGGKGPNAKDRDTGG